MFDKNPGGLKAENPTVSSEGIVDISMKLLLTYLVPRFVEQELAPSLLGVSLQVIGDGIFTSALACGTIGYRLLSIV
jgi:hypothetical protein